MYNVHKGKHDHEIAIGDIALKSLIYVIIPNVTVKFYLKIKKLLSKMLEFPDDLSFRLRFWLRYSFYLSIGLYNECEFFDSPKLYRWIFIK